jgi:hypothetical protein
MSDIQKAYLEGLLSLIKDGRPDPLREVLVARLDRDGAAHHGLASPPLGWDEPDETAVLLVVYDSLARSGDSAGQAYLRRILFDLIEVEFNKPTPEGERILKLGHLLAYCRVADDRELALRLQRSLWGLLTGYLEMPLSEAYGMCAESRKKSSLAFDVWLCVTQPNISPQHAMPPHLVATITEALSKLLECFKKHDVTAWDDIEHLLLLYRGVMKADPTTAGNKFFWEMCQIPSQSKTFADKAQLLRDGWLALCWEYGRVFKVRTDWGRLFYRGLDSSATAEGRFAALPPAEDVEAYLTYFGNSGRAVLEKMRENIRQLTTSLHPGQSENIVSLVQRRKIRAA